MPHLPEFFASQHNLHEKAVLDEGPTSTLFAVEDGSTHEEFTVEIFAAGVEGIVKASTALHGLHHPALAALVGSGTTADGQEFLVRKGCKGTALPALADAPTKPHTQEILTPVAGAVDFLISRNHADFAVHGLKAGRVFVDEDNKVAVLAAAGPGGASTAEESADSSAENDGENITGADAVHAFQKLVAATCPSFTPEKDYSSAKEVVAALRPERDLDTSQFPPVQAEEPESQPQQQFPPQPQQQFPPQNQAGPQYQQQYQQQPVPPMNAAPPKKKGKGGLIALISVLAVIAVAAAGALWYFLSYPSWDDKEKNLADAYPSLIGSRSGQDGALGAECSSRAPEDGQEAKITCSGDGFDYTAAYYPSVEERDAVLPDADPVELSNDRCTIQSYEASTDPQTYVMAVEGTQSIFMVWGDDAEAARLKLPLCAQ
ncbi:serine/threonine protein kinase [Corynebacterium sp. MSK204]|uniref:serine/threonine protein kinase n=1 Tax=Corynebacterium sp. MSK204 TaxID=3050217 RepID=UPI00254A89F4|nr:serine/threonine protein kinase [Corynebacterium sp. MSK204]MDK8658877.1 serine/threonine protein kinase [Corynebacterium sp. MSK204]